MYDGITRSSNHWSLFSQTFRWVRRVVSKTLCDIALIAKKPQEVASRWEPTGSFFPMKENLPPEHVDNHRSKVTVNSPGLVSEFPIESAVKASRWDKNQVCIINHTIHNLFAK